MWQKPRIKCLFSNSRHLFTYCCCWNTAVDGVTLFIAPSFHWPEVSADEQQDFVAFPRRWGALWSVDYQARAATAASFWVSVVN